MNLLKCLLKKSRTVNTTSERSDIYTQYDDSPLRPDHSGLFPSLLVERGEVRAFGLGVSELFNTVMYFTITSTLTGLFQIPDLSASIDLETSH